MTIDMTLLHIPTVSYYPIGTVLINAVSPVRPCRVHALCPAPARPRPGPAVAALVNVAAVAVVADLEPFVAVAAERPLKVGAGSVLAQAAVGALVDVDARGAFAAPVVVAVVALALVAPRTVEALSGLANAVLRKSDGVSLNNEVQYREGGVTGWSGWRKGKGSVGMGLVVTLRTVSNPSPRVSRVRVYDKF